MATDSRSHYPYTHNGTEKYNQIAFKLETLQWNLNYFPQQHPELIFGLNLAKYSY